MINGKRVGVIIPAAGTGSRMGGATSKQFLDLAGSPILLHTLRRFEHAAVVDVIIVSAASDLTSRVSVMVDREGLKKVVRVVEGGRERQDSVWNALRGAGEFKIDIIAVHDGVRPFVSEKQVAEVISVAEKEGAAILAVRSKETVKLIDEKKHIRSTPDRDSLWVAQTPQAFEFRLLLRASEKAMEEGFYGTDEAMLVERTGGNIAVVEGSYDNIKITTPEDLELAKMITNRWSFD
ncbi:MAG TPA: 2-C-methyl-D-erythritol 4-phosphate cytidylyltransferase [Bacteroidota bacterium]|nr:2-C-methyl-D-erythritol 4-phosphate cytidylyltransferase [Bacteroidota bacterium]